MEKYYNSKYYSKPIEVVNIEGEILVIITDSNGREIIYTWYDIIEKNTESIYINKCLLGGFIKKIPENVLIIGFGGGAFAKYLEDHIKNIHITGIDIDEAMIEIAKKELKVKTNDIYIMDAEQAIDKITKKGNKYDLVLIDVYGGDGEIPKYFGNIEFFEKIKNVLNNDGVLSINFADYDLENVYKKQFYDKIHNNLIKLFGQYYSHILAGLNDRGNVMGIYNLDKKYEEKDYYDNYKILVNKGKIIYDENIIK
ncbi:MAG: methyltransferase [Candidatus Gracilibacteria bacterium]|nr:methyltransferase [Candidatus Gracilibacteria bacterium]